jgi:thiol-disulfide isomerase/thioredoxin
MKHYGWLVGGLTVLLVAFAMSTACAQDQSTGAEPTTTLGCGVPPKGSLFQSFTPGVPKLAAVSLQFRPGNEFPAQGCKVMVRIRADKPDGAVLGSAVATAPPPGATAEPVVVFAFEPPIDVTVGKACVIEWVAPEAGDATLMCLATEKDTYAGGCAFDATGKALATQDLAFATYTEVPKEVEVARQRAGIAEELAGADKLIAAGDIPGAMARYRRVLELAQAAGPEALDADDWFAVGTAHYYVMADAFDHALQAGGLDAARRQVAQEWRDAVLNPKPPETAEVVKTIGHGERVNLADHIVQGKTTIVDFYSEFCGPCRQISPLIEKFAHSRNDVAVVKVDINRPGVQGIDWDSPVARQYGLTSVPNFKVYGPDGQLQAEGDAAYQWVMNVVR